MGEAWKDVCVVDRMTCSGINVFLIEEWGKTLTLKFSCLSATLAFLLTEEN
jgi:hypothetical protein